MSTSEIFWDKLKIDLIPVLCHSVAMIVTILGIWLFHFVLKWTLGEDAKLFDRVPLTYVAHTGDSIAFFRFFWKLAMEF